MSEEMTDALAEDVIAIIDRYLIPAPQESEEDDVEKASEAPAVLELPTAGLEHLTLTVLETEAEETPAE